MSASVKDIVKLINEVSRKKRKRPFNVARDLICAVYEWQRSNIDYKSSAEFGAKSELFTTYKYLNDVIIDFHYLYDSVVKSKPFADVLGEVLHEIGSVDKKYLGQCMTPPDISSLTSKLIERYYSKSVLCDVDCITISDPCGCGSGSLILSVLNKTVNVQSLNRIDIHLIDIDEVMIKAAIMQISYNLHSHNKSKKEVPINAFVGNALTMKG